MIFLLVQATSLISKVLEMKFSCLKIIEWRSRSAHSIKVKEALTPDIRLPLTCQTVYGHLTQALLRTHSGIDLCDQGPFWSEEDA